MDAEAVLSATSIGQSSLEYWTRDAQNWMNIYDPSDTIPRGVQPIQSRMIPSLRTQSTFSLPGLAPTVVEGGACPELLNQASCDYLKTAGSGDLAGAVGGGVASAITAAATGPVGAGVVALGAISRGVGASVAVAVFWLVTHHWW